MTDKPAMTIEEMAADLATRCGWVTNDGFRRIHPDDLARAFLHFATEAYARGRRDGLEEAASVCDDRESAWEIRTLIDKTPDKEVK